MPRGKRGRGGGGRGRGGRGRGGGGGGRDTRSNGQDNRVSFDQVNKVNEKFERYYNSLNLVPEGPQREAFWAALRRELPNAFRFCGSKGHALSVRKNLTERFFPQIEKIEHNGEPVELPKQIPWYPEGLAYSMTTPKNVVRKYGPFKGFQRFLVSETGVGNISRQEQVSMIPPLLLDVQPHHTVLDLCAAPGSKSAQLIELLHVGEEERIEKGLKQAKRDEGANGAADDGNNMQDSGRTTGMLVANDVNYQRAQMLVHQVKRLNSPNLVVTNHDATMFPSISLPALPSDSGKSTPGRYLKFDRILADVPCSGDGTTRKNPNIWKDWSPQNGLGLYVTQVRILVRALQMLKSGGRVVYSTCSLNPMENEAVVASAIERCGGSAKVKLIDCSDQLPGLKRQPGLKDWSIMSRGGQIYESWAEAQQFETEGSKVVPGMFPPEANENIPLEHCMRVYPHEQDTGGFFITVLEKTSELRAKPENESKSGNRNWVLQEPEKSIVAAVGREVEVNAKEGKRSDHLDVMDTIAPGPPAGIDGDGASAAMRANPPSPIKRKADEDLDGQANSLKRNKTGESFAAEDGVTTHEHVPLPPSVQQGLEASGATAAAGSAENGDDDVPMNDVPFDASTPAGDQAPPRRRKNEGDANNEESFKYLAPDHPELESIYKFYGLHAQFPRDRFLVRNPAGDPVKGIYYSSQLVKDILTKNEGRGMKFVHAGVKMFMKQDAQGQDICRWRIQTEGLPIVEGWVGDERVVKLHKRSTLRKLLVEMFPKIGGPVGQEGWRELGEIGERVRDAGMGCCVLRVEPNAAQGDDEGFEEGLCLPLWRSLHSLNLMLPKEERRAMLLRIFDEDVELVNHSDPSITRKSDTEQKAGACAETSNGAKGSIPAQQEAEELQERIANAPDEPDANKTSGPIGVEGKALEAGAGAATVDSEGYTVKVGSEGSLKADAVALEADALAREDRLRSKQMEGLENEDRKLAEAGEPERTGEGDISNKDV